MTDRLRVTELDFDTIKSNLKNFLKSQNEFTDYDFDGSGLSVLLDVLAYNTHYNAYYLNMIANESFLDTALLRNSVVSHAKKFGYVPRSASAARATINFTVNSLNSTPGSLTLPRGYTFLSSLLDNKVYNFVTLEDTTVTKTGTSFVFSDLKIYEGFLSEYSFNHSQSSNPKQIFTIPETNIDTSTLKVTVQQSTSNSESIVYTLATDVLDLNANSKVYFLQEGINDQYEIYFGDDVIGKKIPDGGVVNVTYLSTNGSLANRANNFVGTAPVSSFTTFSAIPVAASAGGSEKETVDQIKFAAPLQFTAQNRAVTKNDYVKLIQQRYPQFDAVNVWGGEENDPPVYGKVFISAKPKLGFEVSDTEKEYFINEIVKPISVLTVTPEFVDVDYNYVKLTSTVYFDPTKTNLNTSTLTSKVQNAINFFSTSKGERVMNPLFGSVVKQTLYENMSINTEETLKTIVTDEINRFFPFVSLQNVNIAANEDINQLIITITYSVINFGINDIVNITI
jgi:phage baseplate assembly protein W